MIQFDLFIHAGLLVAAAIGNKSFCKAELAKSVGLWNVHKITLTLIIFKPHRLLLRLIKSDSLNIFLLLNQFSSFRHSGIVCLKEEHFGLKHVSNSCTRRRTVTTFVSIRSSKNISARTCRISNSWHVAETHFYAPYLVALRGGLRGFVPSLLVFGIHDGTCLETQCHQVRPFERRQINTT